MKEKILGHWFVVFIFFPYLVPLIFKDMSIEIQIICSLIIACMCLSYEWYRAEQRNNQLTEIDKDTLRRLFSILNIDDFHANIGDANAWYGYPQKDIYAVIDFAEKITLPSNQIAKDSIRKRMQELSVLLDDFIDFSSMKMYNERNRYILPKENKQLYAQSEKEAEIINQKAKKINQYLNDFRIWLLKKENFDIHLNHCQANGLGGEVVNL